MRTRSYKFVVSHASVVLLLAIGACIQPISIVTECPVSLRVGETGDLLLRHEGPIETFVFVWEVIPAEAGSIEDPSATSTKITAEEAGSATIRLTLSSGLVRVVHECDIEIAPEDG